jgi:hypothetical protein
MIGLGIIEIILLLFILGFVGVSFAFWIWMLVDCAQAPEKPGTNDRLVWILIIVLTGFIGALIYFFVIRMPRRAVSRASHSPAARFPRDSSPPSPPPLR